MRILCILIAASALFGSAVLLGERDIVGSYPVYYTAVFIALLMISGTISVFAAMPFYHQERDFKDVWSFILPVVSGGIFLFLFAYGS